MNNTLRKYGMSFAKVLAFDTQDGKGNDALRSLNGKLIVTMLNKISRYATRTE